MKRSIIIFAAISIMLVILTACSSLFPPDFEVQ